MSAIDKLGGDALTARREGELLWIALNEPERANAFSPTMIRALTEVYSADLRSEGIRAVLLQGNGKHFSAGADLEHLRSLLDASPEENRQDSKRLRALFESVLRQDALTVALVHGACVAGGCGLATAHDFVVGATDARFMYSEVRIGFVAALVATYLPLRLKGSDIRELLLNPEFVGAQAALNMGLINRVVASDELASAGRDLALEVLERASSESIARTKEMLLETLGRPLDQALEMAVEANAQARSTADCKKGMTTFLETKAPPNWRQE